ncbi:MAG TPA: DUF4926 domain-containing protein [Hypericibacter adhaerens]|jgi:hypothetical protein|uniref:DUF4926 domain-containing protein n=1 Tax=Hypericibacter adhaerens TaxID=2602016 RepID=A0A5J6MX14_9PROT|nr:DUF4926 domain-containing protein [Hypericibacter adhaerens]QEX22272.1 hypothetical protein FRZ61_22020 [Hypericibacter adhaerens]HWA43779.1 DUF4926 domain-containing protein [Hypericibacter adhaerens]
MATFSEYDTVMLRTCYPEVPVQRMTKGTILEAYGTPPSAYEVEFPGVGGAYTVPADALVLIRE